MPKRKGTPEGSIVEIKTEEEYRGIILYLNPQKTSQENEEQDEIFKKLTKDKKKSLRRKAAKFTVRQMAGEKTAESWPRGWTVLIMTVEEDGHFVGKIFVPPWHKETIFARFHGANGEAGHFGGRKLYKKVSK